MCVNDDVTMTKVLFGGGVDHEQRDVVVMRLDATKYLLMRLVKHVHAVHFDDSISFLQSYNVVLATVDAVKIFE